MKCLVCKKDLEKRNGKFGKFYFCKDSHGTVSVAGSKIFMTGEMYTKAKKQTQKNTSQKSSPKIKTLASPCLEKQVRSKMAASFGYHMTELDLFVEGGNDTALDEPDNWLNGRVY